LWWVIVGAAIWFLSLTYATAILIGVGVIATVTAGVLVGRAVRKRRDVAALYALPREQRAMPASQVPVAAIARRLDRAPIT